MANDQSPAEQNVRADQTGIAAGRDVHQQAGRDAIGRDRIEIETVVVHPPPVDRAAALDDEQHARLTALVRRWYGDRLTQALDRVVRVELGLDADAAAVSQPLDRFVPRERSVQPLRAGISIREVFADAGGEQGGLLILGDPGAGKTTLLFELAVALSETDRSRLVPTYVPLSTWQQHRRPLAEWLAGQLNEMYFVPRETARRWVQTGRVLPLLDGLDEIEDLDARTACVRAINEFRRQYSLPVVVCSRRFDYQMLPVQLALEAAIIIRPLNPDAVLRHLGQAGPPLAGVRAMLRDDPDLVEFCRSPLLLSMLTLTYYGDARTQLRTGGSLEQRREGLFHDYINRRLDLLAAGNGESEEGRHADAKRQRTLHWLGALARNLVRHDQEVFLLERLAPDWLPTRRARAMLALVIALVLPLGGALTGALIGTLIGGLGALIGLGGPIAAVWGSVGGPGGPLVAGPLVGLLAGLFVALPLGLVAGPVYGLYIGPVGGVLVGLAYGLVAGGLAYGLGAQPWDLSAVWFFTTLIGMVFGPLVGALVAQNRGKDLIARSIRPNEGITRSLKNGVTALLGSALASALIGGLIGGLAVGPGYGLVVGLGAGPSVGVFVGLFYGLGAAIQHCVVRVLLWHYSLAPLRYVRWLEEMVRARLLYRVGGGYEFVHGLLRNYLNKHTQRTLT